VGARTLTFPWTPPSPYRKREIIQGVANGKTSARPMRANARAVLLDALRNAHRLVGRTSVRPTADSGVARLAGAQDRPFDQDDSVARVPRPGRRQGRDRGTPATWLRSQASRRYSDGVARPMAGAWTRAAGGRVDRSVVKCCPWTGSALSTCREEVADRAEPTPDLSRRWTPSHFHAWERPQP